MSSDECFASFGLVGGNVVVVCTVGFVVLVSLLTVSVPTFCVVLRFVSTPATSGVCFAVVVAVVFGAAVVVVGLFCPSKTSVNGHFGTSKKHCSVKVKMSRKQIRFTDLYMQLPHFVDLNGIQNVQLRQKKCKLFKLLQRG